MSRQKIIDDLLADLPKMPVPVRSVLAGAHWIAVGSTRYGLASTILGDRPHDPATWVRDAGFLHEKSAQELAAFAGRRIPSRQALALPPSTRSWMQTRKMPSGSMQRKY